MGQKYHTEIKVIDMRENLPGKIKLYWENLAGKGLYFNFRKLNI